MLKSAKRGIACWLLWALVCTGLLVWAGGCSSSNDDPNFDETTPHTYAWAKVVESPDAALLSVHGTSASNVYAVGADSGAGPLVLHWDGEIWESLDSGLTGDLWWVHAVDDVVFMSGSDAHVVRYQDGQFERMPTPGLGKHTVFGVWAVSPEDVYAVGAVAGRNGFIWHYDGTGWSEVALPEDIPLDQNRDTPPFFKAWGSSANDVCVVGQGGGLERPG